VRAHRHGDLWRKTEALIPIRESAGDCTFSVRLQPRAKRDRVAGAVGDALKISVTAPPVEGKANQACCALLAKVLNLPKSSVSIAAGQSSRNKLVRIAGITAAELSKRLRAAADLE
jgi:uncharacterized protein (TIGR00251 family)